ncbi:MAG: hypothetical protein POELPBGB_02753 [Bacteroidia bacterium]|nr:hypothetical protein [Bacteroidia bacterium]
MLLLVVTGTYGLSAAEIIFEASSKSTVSLGERFQVAFELNTNGSGFKAPSFTGFDILSGPNQSTSMQFVNGNMSQSLTYSFVLQATKEGTYTISPAKIKVNGTEIESNELKITVVKGSSNTQQSQQNGKQQGTQGQQGASSSDGQTFVRISFSKTKAYRGEAIVVTHKIYTKQSIVGFEDVKFPSYDGFWSEDIQQPQQITLNRETYNGEVYNAGVLKQSILYPQKAGKIQIDPFVVDVIIREQTRGGNSIFDQFFGSYQDVKKSLKTSTTSLDILPYPLTEQPADFSGLTGDFTMKAEITKTQVEANDAVNLKITISGTGNMKQVDSPSLEFPPDIESYDPKTVDNIKVGASNVSGSRTFDYLLIPRHAGEFKIGPFSFSYFDAVKGKYVTLTQSEFTLQVGKGSGEEDKATGVTIASKEDLKVLGSDIRFIKTNEATVTEKGKYFFRSPLFFTLSGIPLLLYLGFFLWHRNMVKQSGNVALMKSRRANKIAGKRLALAKKFLQEKKKNEYYEEIFKALWGYISDKLSIPVAELTKEKIKETMLAKNINESTINEFIALLDKAEFARFAPSGGEREMDTVYTESADVISKIEGNV